MEKKSDLPTRTESKAKLVEQITGCVRAGDYSRALELLRGAATDFPNDAELSKLEERAHGGVQRIAEANRLITESQELFAQRKSTEAIQLLRQAYELDKNNSLARAILSNALAEHAQSIVETDWLEAETLTNQALALNPAHPTAKTIRDQIVDQKQASSVEYWVARAQKLQSSGDLFAALAWVAEGMAVHPDNPKLLQIHEAIQRDQAARRRQARRGDVEDLRRMQREIDGAADGAAKQALAERIQAVAAKYWTDGEILSIANALLLRLGVVSQENSSASSRGKGATVILHVPRPGAQETPHGTADQIPPSPTPPVPVMASPVVASPAPPSPVQVIPVQASPVQPQVVPDVVAPESAIPPSAAPRSTVPPNTAPTSQVLPSKVPLREVRSRKVSPSITPLSSVLTTPPKPQIASPQVTAGGEASAPPARITSPRSRPKQPASSNSKMLIVISAAAIILVAATFFFTRRHYAASEARTQSAAPAASAPVSAPAPATAAQATPAPAAPTQTTPVEVAPTQPPPETSLPAPAVASESATKKVPHDERPRAESGHNVGTLLIVAGQDNARVFLNGTLQLQLTQGGQLRLSDLELKDYVVKVSKSGFQDPPQQKVRLRKGEPARLVFHLQPQNQQPQSRLAALTIQGGAPGTTVLVDQAMVGTVQGDGTLSVSNVNPGDHTVELRKDRFKPRQLKKHFVAGGTTSLTAADAALEAALEATTGELKITFAPADSTVALVKGDLLKMVSSGVPLNLPPGTYTLTARTAERFTRSSTLDVVAGQSKTLNLSLAPNGMSKWEDPGGWKQEKDAFIHKGGDFVLYSVAPASGTFNFSAMVTKGHFLQWVLNYSDPKNYVLCQMDEDGFSRAVIRNGAKTGEVKIADKGDKKSFRTIQIRVSSTELVHQIKHGDHWIVLDRMTQPGANFGQGKFGFFIPGSDQIALSGFTHYVDLNLR